MQQGRHNLKDMKLSRLAGIAVYVPSQLVPNMVSLLGPVQLALSILPVLFFLFVSPARAQGIVWTQTDVGATGATGSYTYNSTAQTYTVSGAGTNIDGDHQHDAF